MRFSFKIIIAFFFILPIFGYTDWDEDKICLQTLICNVNGELIKDNKDNRSCIGSALAAGVNLEKQENDAPPMCLSLQKIRNNPHIDFQANRVDLIPPAEESPETPLPVFGGIFVTLRRDLGALQTPEMYDNRGNPDAYQRAVQRRDAGLVKGFEHLRKLPGETPRQYYDRITTTPAVPIKAAPAAPAPAPAR
jgi:hypothetical protein